MKHSDTPGPQAAHRSRAEAAGLLLGLLGTALLLNQHLLRFLVETDLWHGLRPPALAAWEASHFQSAWPLELFHAVAASLALLLGPRAVACVMGEDRPSGGRPGAFLGAFWIACLAAAGSAAATSLLGAGHGAGGTALLFYGPGLGLLWVLFVAMAAWGGRRSPLIRRDWTIYCYAVALLPLSTLPAVPLWAALPGLDLDAALVTAVTMAFPAHLLAAHLVIFEVLERRSLVRRRAGAG